MYSRYNIKVDMRKSKKIININKLIYPRVLLLISSGDAEIHKRKKCWNEFGIVYCLSVSV